MLEKISIIAVTETQCEVVYNRIEDFLPTISWW